MKTTCGHVFRKNNTVVLDFRERAPLSLPIQRSVFPKDCGARFAI
jgi:hypothetical protein